MRSGAATAGLCSILFSGSAAAETLADYASSTSDPRSVTITSKSGQKLRLTAYGNHIVRVVALRTGETAFADDRYEMVAARNHTEMKGSLSVVDEGALLKVTTGSSDGLEVVIRKTPLRLEFYETNGVKLLVKEDATHSMSWSDGTSAATKQRWAPAQTSEHFFKAGSDVYGRSTRLDRTGTTTSWNYADPSNPGVYQAPVSLPLYLSTLGYGVFFNTAFDTRFVFGDADVYEFSASDKQSGGPKPQLDYFFIQGPSFAQMIARYTQLTGRPRLPREAIFGLQLSDKNFPKLSGSEWWEKKITAHRNAGFPLDVHVNDNRWRDPNGLRSGSRFRFWTANGGSWSQPTPQAYKAWADAHGILTILDYNRNNSKEMAGWRPGAPPGYSFRPTDLTRVPDNDAVPDWSGPAARAWVWSALWETLNPALGMPGDGLWLDETDELYAIPETAVCANGWRWAELRNYYSFLLQKAVGEGWDRQIGTGRRPWTFGRSATAGMQRYGHFWSGDIDSTYTEMAAQIRGMLSIGLGGFPYFNHDAGGFHGEVISPAMYRQWVAAFGAFSPIWRPHSEGDTSALGAAASRWPLDHSPIEQADFAKYARERYTMMPYIYSLAREAATTGMPLARAMVIEYQNSPKAWSHDLQYMWGPALLVAPNASDGGAPLSVWLPAGDTWYYFWDDKKIAGDDASDYTYSPETGELPIFVKNGAIVPRYPFAKSVKEMDRTELELEVYAGKDGAFDLLEDDGTTEDWRLSSRQHETKVTFESARTRVLIHHSSGLPYVGAPVARSYTVRLHGYSSATGMRVNGGPNLRSFASEAAARTAGGGVVWDDAKKLLSVVTEPIAVTLGGGVAVAIEPSGAAFGVIAPPAGQIPPPHAVSGCGCGVSRHSGLARFALFAVGLGFIRRKRRRAPAFV